MSVKLTPITKSFLYYTLVLLAYSGVCSTSNVIRYILSSFRSAVPVDTDETGYPTYPKSFCFVIGYHSSQQKYRKFA